MKYFWVKIEDKYDWYEYFVFTENESDIKALIQKDRDDEFEIVDIQENEDQVIGQAIQIRQGCD